MSYSAPNPVLEGGSTLSEQDRRFMAAALRYGLRHQAQTNDNPSVGALIVDESCTPPRILGRGVTAKSGRPHAEPQALTQAAHGAKGAKGATAYVTLEPCSHFGQTPPCAQALIDAGIARVVIAYQDPDARVDGKGIAMLKNAGIRVDLECLCEQAAWDLRGFLSRTRENRPHIHLKLALSADGKLGHEGVETAITGEEVRAQVHLMRAQSDAILVGSNTVRVDDPSLNVRLAGLDHRSPHRFVLSKSANIPIHSTLCQSAHKVPLTIVHDVAASIEKKDAYEALGVEFLAVESNSGQISWPLLLEQLAQKNISTLMVEGGATIASSLWQSGLADEISIFTSQNKLGQGAVESEINETIINKSGKYNLRETALYGADKLYKFTLK